MAELGEKIQFIQDGGSNEHHVYHHTEPSKPSVNVQVEKNSRGTNWSATVVGASSVAEAMELLLKARNELEHNFGTNGA